MARPKNTMNTKSILVAQPSPRPKNLDVAGVLFLPQLLAGSRRNGCQPQMAPRRRNIGQPIVLRVTTCRPRSGNLSWSSKPAEQLSLSEGLPGPM